MRQYRNPRRAREKSGFNRQQLVSPAAVRQLQQAEGFLREEGNEKRARFLKLESMILGQQEKFSRGRGASVVEGGVHRPRKDLLWHHGEDREACR